MRDDDAAVFPEVEKVPAGLEFGLGFFPVQVGFSQPGIGQDLVRGGVAEEPVGAAGDAAAGDYDLGQAVFQVRLAFLKFCRQGGLPSSAHLVQHQGDQVGRTVSGTLGGDGREN